MEAANGHVLEALMGLGRLARTDGELNADFAHVRRLITGYHGESSLVTVEVAGDARPRALLEAILKHPYLYAGSEFRNCEGLIVSLVGDESMSMEEVDEFMAHLKATASRAKVILGVHVDDAMGKGMGAMVLMPRRPVKAVHPASVKRETLQISMPKPSRTQPSSTRDFQQQQLPLVPISKGRFDKGEPNLHDGEDLDVPTFLRRNMILN
jgi:cell division protein FtsZ